MLELTKSILASQMDAALQMLEACIDACPETAWDASVCNLTFNQAVFHTLFFTDCYLSENTDAMLAQPYHREHADFFRTYEELENKRQELAYDRPAVRDYFSFCRRKAVTVIAAETEATLSAQVGFPWLKFSRAELHIYNTRHIHHHAAQLSLRLRLEHGDGIPWVKAGVTS